MYINEAIGTVLSKILSVTLNTILINMLQKYQVKY